MLSDILASVRPNITVSRNVTQLSVTRRPSLNIDLSKFKSFLLRHESSFSWGCLIVCLYDYSNSHLTDECATKLPSPFICQSHSIAISRLQRLILMSKCEDCATINGCWCCSVTDESSSHRTTVQLVWWSVSDESASFVGVMKFIIVCIDRKDVPVFPPDFGKVGGILFNPRFNPK